jgi:hypothetical protein
LSSCATGGFSRTQLHVFCYALYIVRPLSRVHTIYSFTYIEHMVASVICIYNIRMACHSRLCPENSVQKYVNGDRKTKYPGPGAVKGVREHVAQGPGHGTTPPLYVRATFSTLGFLLYLNDGGNMFFRNVGKCLQNYTAPHPSSKRRPWESFISYHYVENWDGWITSYRWAISHYGCKGTGDSKSQWKPQLNSSTAQRSLQYIITNSFWEL